jgi:hypothetical protein
MFGQALRRHCQFCLGLPWQQCACWDGERSLPEGASCPYMMGDVSFPGVCAGGLCTY